MPAVAEFDAVIVGAGFSGLRMVHELRRLGLSVRVLEAGSDVGGTWYWNRYPGARTDSEAWSYCMRFDEELNQEWVWTERFPSQPEVERYLRHVAERFDMRKDIQFNTRVTAAAYDAAGNTWTVTTEQGESFTCRYFVCATGLLSVTYAPPFPGVDTFQGEWHQTSLWPKEPVGFLGKRVGVVGTGATAVQLIPEVAAQASHLTVFQRSANFVMPSRNHQLRDAQRDDIKRNYDKMWSLVDNNVFGFPFEQANRLYSECGDQERRAVLERGWESGGFRYALETFDDMLTNQECNDVAADLVRQKIRALVNDPATAELLCPDNHPLFGKRPPLGHFYYETFNRDNVSLVSVKNNPIARITPKGIQLEDGTEYELDLIVFAVGFDAVTGAMSTMNIEGLDGRTISQEWSVGARNYLGVTVDGYPNMFMLQGPGGAFSNIPIAIDWQAGFIGSLVEHAINTGNDRIEANADAAAHWGTLCRELQESTLMPKAKQANSWFIGANIPGKAADVLFYMGGAPEYKAELDKEVSVGFPGFSLQQSAAPAIPG